MRANYAANVELIDEQRAIFFRPSKTAVMDTVIGFTSDHGEMNGDHGLVYKGFLDAAAWVPLIIYTPHIDKNPGTSSDALVELMDIGPTLVECAGGSRIIISLVAR